LISLSGSVGSARISSIRLIAPIPLCQTLRRKPKAMVGQTSMPRYTLKATSSPLVS